MSATLESHEVLRQALEKVSPKEISAQMGLSLSIVYKWAQPQTEHGGGATNPLDRTAALIHLTRDPGIVQWLCQQAEGFFVSNPHHSLRRKENGDVMPALNQIVQQFADLLEAITKSATDRLITPEEARRIRTEWDQLKSSTESFVHACEKGEFNNVSAP